MPTLLDLLREAGVTVPDDLNLSEMIEKSDEVKGLATAKNDLNQWKLENKPLLEQMREEQEALKAKAKEEEEKALKLAQENGDFKTQSEITAKRLQDLEDGLKASRERTQKSALEAAQKTVAAAFKDPIYGDYYAGKSAVVELSESGEPVTSFKFGDKTFNTFDEWRTAAAADKTCASMMPIGNENNAPGATGQDNNLGGGGKNQAAETAKSNGDSLAYLNAALSGN